MVDGLYATGNIDVYITGSNANLLSSELATLLSGRYIEISIQPFSFAEYLETREKTADRGHILENVVYLELLRRGYKIWTGKLRDGEIDFTVKNRSGEIEYYQVSWEISNAEIQKREFAPLETIKDNYPKFLLTTDSFTQNKAGIIHKNVFEWLLKK